VFADAGSSAHRPGDASAEADRTLAWLAKSIAAGFKDAARIKADAGLTALRERADFKKIVAELAAASEQQKK
jgi:hypothetical protein